MKWDTNDAALTQATARMSHRPCDFVSKVACAVLYQRCNRGPHVFALKRRRPYLANKLVCRAHAALKVGAHHPLAGGIRPVWGHWQGVLQRPVSASQTPHLPGPGSRCSTAIKLPATRRGDTPPPADDPAVRFQPRVSFVP
jgi:hypothetical protein